MVTRIVGRIVILLVAVVLSGSCSDDDASSSQDGSTLDATSTDTENEEATGPTSRPDENETPPTDDAQTESFCEAFAPLNTEADEIFATGSPDADAIRDLVDGIERLDAPDEIAVDLALTVEAFRLLADSLDGDSTARDELNDRFQEFEDASERLEPFFRETCGLDFGD